MKTLADLPHAPRPASVLPSPEVQVALDELDTLAALEDDWDAHDAPPISPQALYAASVLLKQSAEIAHRQNRVWKQPDIAPTPSGAVYLHWRETALSYSAIVPSNPEVITVLRGKKNQRAERLMLNLDAASEAVANFMATQAQPV